MGETKLKVDVETLRGRGGLTTSTNARYHDSDNDYELKGLASEGCNSISNYLTEAQMAAMMDKMPNFGKIEIKLLDFPKYDFSNFKLTE